MQNGKKRNEAKKQMRRKVISIIIIVALVLSIMAILINAVSVKAAETTTLTTKIDVVDPVLSATTNYNFSVIDTQKNIKYFEYFHNYSIFDNYTPVISGYAVLKLSGNSIRLTPNTIGKSFMFTLTNIKNPNFEMSESSCVKRIGGVFSVYYMDGTQEISQTNSVRTVAPVLKISNDSLIDSYSGKPIQLNFTLDAGVDTTLSEIHIKMYNINPIYFTKTAFCKINGTTVNSFYHGSDFFYIEVPEGLKSPYNVILDKSMNISTPITQNSIRVEYSCIPTNSGFIENRGNLVLRTYTLQKYVVPAVPVITNPKNNSALDYSSGGTLIQWTKSEGATEYAVNVLKKDKITGTETPIAMTTPNNSITLYLDELVQYTVKVNAKDVSGVNTKFSDPVTFSMNPTNISPLMPADSSFIPMDKTTISFSVANAKIGSSYTMKLGRTKDLSDNSIKTFNGKLDSSTSNIEIPTSHLEAGATYYWTIREIIPQNYLMPWTEIRSFTFGSDLKPTFSDNSKDGSPVLKQNPFNLNYTDPDPSKDITLSFYNETKNKFLLSFDMIEQQPVNILTVDLPKELFNYYDTFIARLEFSDKTFSTGFDEMRFVLVPSPDSLIIEPFAININYDSQFKRLFIKWPLITGDTANIKKYKVYLLNKDTFGNFSVEKTIESALNFVSFDLSTHLPNSSVYIKIQAIPSTSDPLDLDKLPYYEFVIPGAEDSVQPILVINSPLDDSFFFGDPNIKITGVLSDAESGPLKIQVGDSTEIPVGSDGKFSFNWVLNEGDNIITILGFDKNLNVIDQTIVLHYKSQRKMELTIDKKEATVDGQVITLDASPFIQSGRTMVPLRFISESLGFQVSWDSINRTVTVTSNNLSKTIMLTISSKIAKIIGMQGSAPEYYALDSPAIINNGRTMVPIRFIVEQFGGKITYDASTKKITIVF